MAKVKIIKTSNEVMVVVKVEKETIEALNHFKNFVKKDKDGKETYRLSLGTPCVKDYGVAVNGETTLVEKVETDNVDNTVTALKFKYAAVEAKLTAIEKELVANYKVLKENAEKVEVETC